MLRYRLRRGRASNYPVRCTLVLGVFLAAGYDTGGAQALHRERRKFATNISGVSGFAHGSTYIQCSAVLMAGTGFRAAAVRSVVTGLTHARQPTRTASAASQGYAAVRLMA